jgi:hypothetical protein
MLVKLCAFENRQGGIMSSSEFPHYRWASWLAGIAFVLSVVSFVWPAWLEQLFGDTPDGGNGLIEYALAVGFALVALALVVWPYLAKRRAARLRTMDVRHDN